MFKNEKLRSIATKATAVVTTAMVAAPAFAGDLADAVTQSAEPAELTLIGVAVLTLCGVILMIRSGKRAAS
ncbi:MAG: hypothetical protein ACRES5_08515 [Pseudomonas sp.]|uniref:hypothetical protein n=1 Tax=Stenotrophomonas sp. TaxID=69392 RepID=UPI003D6D0760